MSPGVQFKLYPCCGSITGCIDAILYLIHNKEIIPQDIKEIECLVSPLAMTTGASITSPKNGSEGRFSLNYCMAIAVIENDVSLLQFSDEKVNLPLAKDLASKVKVTFPSDAINEMQQPQEVKVKLRNGKVYSRKVEKHKGTPDNPCTSEELENKFRRCALLKLRENSVEQLFALISNIEKLGNMNRLMELMTYGK